jgi:hypothetical protein
MLEIDFPFHCGTEFVAGTIFEHRILGLRTTATNRLNFVELSSHLIPSRMVSFVH